MIPSIQHNITIGSLSYSFRAWGILVEYWNLGCLANVSAYWQRECIPGSGEFFMKWRRVPTLIDDSYEILYVVNGWTPIGSNDGVMCSCVLAVFL